MENTKLKSLTGRDKEVLRKLVKWKCEQCGGLETEGYPLQIHRIKRGNKGGEYTLRNIKLLCLDCHQLFHYNEPGAS